MAYTTKNFNLLKAMDKYGIEDPLVSINSNWDILDHLLAQAVGPPGLNPEYKFNYDGEALSSVEEIVDEKTLSTYSITHQDNRTLVTQKMDDTETTYTIDYNADGTMSSVTANTKQLL